MQVGYVVLYVNDVETCRRFWTEQIHMVEKRRSEAGEFTIVQVGFADQPFAFELVPLGHEQHDLGRPSAQGCRDPHVIGEWREQRPKVGWLVDHDQALFRGDAELGRERRSGVTGGHRTP